MPGKHAEYYALMIIERRKELGHTQKAMAEMMGVTRRTYQTIESGKMSLKQFIWLCEVLDLGLLVVPGKYLK